ncbi:MAG: hypothetical protein M9962_14930 [Oligoflexia bacterium]|nr:hypothetical protein [Oligoflexia bacterium]
MKTTLTLFVFLISFSTQAAVFDAADTLPKHSGAIGVFGELLLSDPTSEGVEFRSRYGLSEEWDLGALIGFGSKSKRFRFGGEGVYNIIPDWENQIGLSAMASAVILKRPGSTGLQLRIAPLAHKKFVAWNDLPVLVYASFPLYLEGRSGTYTTGTQFVIGSLLDLASNSRTYMGTEVGIKIAKSESYILAGVGYRFGTLRFYRKEKKGHGNSGNQNANEEDEYRDEDFQ